MTTNADVRRWLDAYIAAWATYDEAAIGALFTDDAEYRFFPADPPFVGRKAIVEAWVRPSGLANTRDEPGTWTAAYEPWLVGDDGRAVAVGTTTYWSDATRTILEDVYDNAYLLELAPDGRCRRFTEFYVRRREPPPSGDRPT
jgi:ketosteroid isomerase-like protein